MTPAEHLRLAAAEAARQAVLREAPRSLADLDRLRLTLHELVRVLPLPTAHGPKDPVTRSALDEMALPDGPPPVTAPIPGCEVVLVQWKSVAIVARPEDVGALVRDVKAVAALPGDAALSTLGRLAAGSPLLLRPGLPRRRAPSKTVAALDGLDPPWWRKPWRAVRRLAPLKSLAYNRTEAVRKARGRRRKKANPGH